LKRKTVAILKILKDQKQPVGSFLIARRLKEQGIDLSERTVRYHLKKLDEMGYTRVVGREGRLITQAGLEELGNALVADKAGMVIARMENLSYLTTFDFRTQKGKVPLNISFFSQGYYQKAKRVLKWVFKKKLALIDRLIILRAGETLGEVEVPVGYLGLGTVCSVVVNGVLIKEGIPVAPRFGGLLQYTGGKPWRFTDLINYEGSTLDPLEVFIRSRMTSVKKVARTGEGKVLVSFREVPATALKHVEGVVESLREIGFFGIIKLGRPNQPLFEASVLSDRAGLAVVGGLNPLAALEESGIPTENRAMGGLIEFEKLIPFSEL